MRALLDYRLYFLFFSLSLNTQLTFGQDANIQTLLSDVNSILASNSVDPILPTKEDLINQNIFENGDEERERYFSTTNLNTLMYVYTAYGKYFKKNESSFVFFHISLLNYSSDLVEYWFNHNGVDRPKILSGMTRILTGSITVMGAQDDLMLANRMEIANKTKAILDKWWEKLTQPMRAEVYSAAARCSDVEKDPTMKATFEEIKDKFSF